MKQDAHGSNDEEWVGFDLDGTLAEYDGWKGVDHIGDPVDRMVIIAKLLHWLGKKVKVLTARVAPRDDGDGGDKARKYVEKWCENHLGFVPEITYHKDASMAALFDDRAVAVEQNTGKVLGGWPDFLPKASERAKKAVLGKTEKKAETRLYTYLPKDNTALTEGILSTVRTKDGWKKYKGRTGKSNKKDVLEVLDSWEPEWTRSKAISTLTNPIPSDAAEDFLEFSRNHKLYSFDVKDLAKAKILAHIRLARKGGGTDPVDEVRPVRANWKRKKKHLLFQGVPHYFIETKDGKIPPEFVREEKSASARPSKEDLWRMYDIMKADARLSKKVEGLGFGRNGDAYRRAAIKLKVIELARLLNDGKRIRNNIAHRPEYVPSEQDANRAIRQYADAESRLESLL